MGWLGDMPFLMTILLLLAYNCEAFTRQQKPACSRLLKDYHRDLGKHIVPSNTSNSFIFFLHVPRTAGKTYAQCFLRASSPPSTRCSPSYDFLRLNTSQAGCRYLVSHDDYSLTQQLPENSAIVTQLRNPVNRVISAYEFAIEVAARRIHMPDNDFTNQQANRTFVNTLNVWPWSYLVPSFRRDMRLHRSQLLALAAEEGRKPTWEEYHDDKENRTYYYNPITKQSVWEKPRVNATLEPYNNSLVTPLAHWIEGSVARELVHDGATLQILGLTNNSHWPGASELRQCYFEDAETHDALVDHAKHRLRALDHVGLTEQLDDSVASLAASLGRKFNDTAYKSAPKTAFMYEEPSVDPEKKVIEYNRTLDAPLGGEITTISITNARRLMLNLSYESKQIKDQLAKLEPELEDLVSREDEWLEEEDARREAGLLGRLRAAWRWLRKVVITKKVPSDYDHGDDYAGSVPSESKQSTGDGEKTENEDIDSPWAEQITALDAKVYSLQQRSEALGRDYATLAAMPELKNPDIPDGRATLLLGDEQFIEPRPLGESYRKCSEDAANKASKKRRHAFQNLRTPWEESFAFTPESRKAIDPAIVERIRQLNKADVEIYELGQDLLERALQRQKVAGILEPLPLKQKPPSLEKKAQPISAENRSNPNEESSPEDESEVDAHSEL